MKPTPKPLPCPFCGRKPAARQLHKGLFLVSCPVITCLVVEAYGDTALPAIAAWNRRTPVTPDRRDAVRKHAESVMSHGPGYVALRAAREALAEAVGLVASLAETLDGAPVRLGDASLTWFDHVVALVSAARAFRAEHGRP